MRKVFSENSVIVKTWVGLVIAGTYTQEQVPNLSNLREMVSKAIEKLKGE